MPGWASSLISFLGCSVVVAPLCGHGERHEGTVVSPDGPGDAGQLVGESDGGLVVAEPSLESEGPGSESVVGGGFLGVAEDGTCAVDEQHSEVGVTALGDSAQTSAQTAGVFSRGETQEAGEVTSRREAPDVSQESDQGGGDHQADARDRPQALDRGDLLGQGFELSLGQLDVVAEGLNLVAGRGQDVPESVRNAGVGVGDEG